MRDSDVLISKGSRWAYVLGLSALIGLLIVQTAYVGFRLRTTYVLQTEMALLRAEHTALEQRYEILETETTYRLDELERVLFGDVLAKVNKTPATPPAALKNTQWFANVMKDVRERLARLETWRLEHGEPKDE